MYCPVRTKNVSHYLSNRNKGLVCLIEYWYAIQSSIAVNTNIRYKKKVSGTTSYLDNNSFVMDKYSIQPSQ